MPKISCLLNSFNREKYVEAAVNSILNQTFDDFELLIVDDCSADKTFRILERLSKSDSRIKLFKTPVNLGSSGSRKLAENHATSEYMCWMDSDDLLHPNAFESALDLLAFHPNSFTYSKYSLMDEMGRIYQNGFKCDIPYSYKAMLVDFVTFQFRMIPSEWYFFLGGVDTSFKYSEDYDFCLRLCEKITPVHLPEYHYSYRKHPNTIGVEHRALQAALSCKAANNSLERCGFNDFVVRTYGDRQVLSFSNGR